MQIRVLKDTKAASCPLGISVKEYKAGESYEIYNDLAEVFLAQGWGESEQKMFTPKLENKLITSAPENKAIMPTFEDAPLESKKKAKSKK